MKYLFSFLLCVLSLSSFAQDNIEYRQIPKSWRLKDKIILVNKSPYYILNTTVAIVEKNGNLIRLGTPSSISVNEEYEYASFDDNRLKSLRGETIAIKTKGLKRPINYFENLDNIPSSEVTYDFNYKLFEYHHDLYIEIYYSGRTNNKDIMDF